MGGDTSIHSTNLSPIVPKVRCRICGQTMLKMSPTHLSAYHPEYTMATYRDHFGMIALRPEIEGKVILHMPGGPGNSKLTPEVLEKICMLARKGYPPRLISQAIGVSMQTFRTWIAKGDPDNINAKTGEPLAPPEYYVFYTEYKKAEAEAEQGIVDSFLGFTKTDWRAASDFLAKRWPESWRPESKKVIDVSGAVEHTVRDLKIEELLDDPDTAALACALFEKLNAGDQDIEVEDAELVEDTPKGLGSNSDL